MVTSQQPEHVITAARDSSLLRSIGALWQARDVVRAFASRSLRIRYRQAAFGVVWSLAQPLALLLPFWFFLRDRQSPGAIPYAAGTLAALVGWQYLSSAVSSGSSALVAEAFLVRKTWFPREAPVLAAVLAALADLAIGIALLGVIGPFLGARIGWTWLALPIVVLVLVVVALALAVPLAAVNARYRDVRHGLPFLVLVWLFATPVAFAIERLPQRWWPLYALLNPAVGPLVGLRRALAGGLWPDWQLLGLSVLASLVWFVAGHRLFRRVAPTLPDVV